MVLFSFPKKMCSFFLTNISNDKLLIIFALLSISIFGIQGCVSTPEYTDPLAGIQNPSSNPIFASAKLGLIYSENTRKTIAHLQGKSGATINFFVEKPEDYNPYFVTQGMHDLLNQRFGEVIELDGIELAKSQNIDIVMVFDFRFHKGAMSGESTSVELTGIFMNSNAMNVDTIRAEGYATIPYPYNVSLKPAANAAFKTFSQQLDASNHLAAALGQNPAGSQLAYTQVKSTKGSKSPIYTPQGQSPSATIPKKKSIETDTSSYERGYGISKYWAVIIGISKYKESGKNGLTNLIFADDDAKAFAGVLRNLGWSESHIKLLTNEEATKRNIEIALESWLTKAAKNDYIVLFWAGHGFPDPEDPEKVYFCCFDTDISIPATGYRMDRVRDALEERNSQNVLLLADTCHAGKLITRGDRGVSIVPNIDKMRREKTIPKGWIFMVGADTDRQAIEHTSWSNGAFTHCLVKGLTGEADGYESIGAVDGVVTMGELRAFMNSEMPEETLKVLGVAKRAIITTSTGDPDIWDFNLRAK